MGDAVRQPLPRATVAVVIPVRFGSRRVPRKPRARLGDKPLVQHVYERVRAPRGVSLIVVATDDVRIRDCVMGFGGEAILTGSDLRTGSDRVAAVAREVPADAYVNLQGDEIPLAPGLLEDLIHPFIHSDAEVGTLKRAITEEHELLDPNVVKVLTDRNGGELYFSLRPVTYMRRQSARRR